jgi:glucuronyl/N-acetylglucosaminyl transferase EXT1
MKHKMLRFKQLLFLLVMLIISFIIFQNHNITNYKVKLNENIKSETNNLLTKCSIADCFNVSKCDFNNFKIYIYLEPKLIVSNIYKKIIEILSNSNYRTYDPNEACLFVASVDTLDRDKLSVNYVRNLKNIFPSLRYWNKTGQNHIIFNLYSGTWPDYLDNLGFNSNHAILVKASFSKKSYRKNFDISFPLFHQDLPFNNSFTEIVIHQNSTLNKTYMLTFKGKRYLNGYGSETRNALYHINNDRDIILLTTCRHGNNWIEFKDSRCDIDNIIYEK